MADLIPASATLQEGKEAINKKIALIDSTTASLQSQISNNDIDSKSKLQAHQSSTTAHTASNITFSPSGTGMASTNTQAAIKEAWDRAGNIIAYAGTSSAEVVDIRTVENGYTPSRTITVAGDAIRDLQSKFAEQSNQTATLKHGLNVISTKQSSPTKFSIYGTTRVNLLGNIGSFDKDSNGDGVADGWTKGVNAKYSMAANNGGLGQLITAQVGDASTERVVACSNTMTITGGKYYLFLIDAIVTSTGKAFAQVYAASPLLSVQDTATSSRTIILKINPSLDSLISIYLKNNENTGGTGSVMFDNARMVEVSAADYAKASVDPDWTGDKLAEKFPYVDGTKHLQGFGVKKVGKNLLQGFPDTLHNEAVMNAPYDLVINATGTFRNCEIFGDVVPNQSYTFSITKDAIAGYAEVSFLDSAGTSLSTTSGWNRDLAAGTYTTSLTAPATATRLRMRFTNSSTGTFRFSKWQVEVGSISTPFEPYNADYIFLPTILASNLDGNVRDTAYERENVWYKYKKWQTGVPLDGSWTWNNAPSAFTGFKEAYLADGVITNILKGVQSYRNLYFTKHDGLPVFRKFVATAEADSSYVSSGGALYLRVPNSDTGTVDGYTMSAQEWKNYFNGWKMNNGTIGTAYPGTGTKYWTPIVTPKANFVGKVAGTVVENPHIFKRTSTNEVITTLKTPSTSWSETTDQHYGWIRNLDGSTSDSTSLGSGYIPQQMFSFNIIEHVLRKHGTTVFGTAVTTTDRVTWLKANIGRIAVNWYGYGSGPAGNKVYLSQWGVNSVQWWSGANHSSSTVNKLYLQITSLADRIGSDGLCHVLAYADASDGTTASTVYTDYIDLDVELNVQTVPNSGYSSVEYKPYTLDYVLATPVEEVISNSEGMISLASGGNQIELFEGVIVREKTTPQLSGGTGNYDFNGQNRQNAPYSFKNRADKIIAIYRNGVSIPFTTWFNSNSYGNQSATIKSSDYDATAEYTVTYTLLDKYLFTTNLLDATLNYQGSQKSVVDTLVQKVADDETKISIHSSQIINILARMRAANIV
ncbi:hypothetical protein M3194_15795 [Paenibacillus glycanilyticus]|uniref:hypothetical protein n=1 Tax=Paenibacillus glycanilyticus TaxID=126569 RepID=UPI0020416A82|nr:hypothetical protein [Paenibacillus glycanilyticus]MCM3628807.1 hypothetical protein [Paenibacillus glycanilyticus]